MRIRCQGEVDNQPRMETGYGSKCNGGGVLYHSSKGQLWPQCGNGYEEV